MDLNIIVHEDELSSEQSIQHKIGRAFKEGFKKIALSTLVSGDDIANIPIPIKLQPPDGRILSRLTVKVDDTSQLYHLTKHENLKLYDLLAIEPLNEKVLNYINNGNYDCDLISFSHRDNKMANILKKSNFSLPISKGIGIEINYADCLSSSSQRRQTIACGQMLVDKTNAKNIVLSSGTTPLVNCKSPRDTIYIGLLFGLNEYQSKKATFENGVNVIKHSELRRNIISSAIEVIDEIMQDELNYSNKRILEADEQAEGCKKSRAA